MHGATETERCHSPNAIDIFAHFRGVRALQLAQLRVPFNLEEHLLAVLRRHLCAIGAEQNMSARGHGRTKLPFSHPPTQCPPLAHTKAEPPTANSHKFWDDTEHGRTYLDIDGRVGLLHLWLLVLRRCWLLVGHGVYLRVGGGRQRTYASGSQRRSAGAFVVPPHPRASMRELRNARHFSLYRLWLWGNTRALHRLIR